MKSEYDLYGARRKEDEEKWLKLVNYYLDSLESGRKIKLKDAAEASGYTPNSASNQLKKIRREINKNKLVLTRDGKFIEPSEKIT
ncbi:hypothetical protein A3A76_00745 [Candidatus Woesebacteria bacterium RIFCSPLOWO2_01_FULL_39_23]|uniref:HTH dtxR-type domain-containing protein n=1 Tax=Candidatus Woesebacteria bacterium RIFCSPHIGHO2_01_FULL_40_22 TaxID=1802499 RepID=A0A1F7YHJ6_9BACT|nr:MAG: hypothetical protein A2141_05390 [Candidatus Woesebacteria bacterium RBG_16_40_11]OGM26773.1 MAG: hypothetical protein A2628_04420 [Candidatus Woesebacteria bacterium RIFCSPHIGHO2_01_FULL_40_22]OGM37892.1 MAG: hypothetical protein A3E41_01080 [Candidatus Woesebacteria bacterium RIFCSPHIGHO2_12_FULL_38_9]OGM63069.1 MAG: hypothetical protein A3A76_00745 [Candidatus Woesebacteria bacterium RIFCSPLOWO2_01_FULL_39_23]